MVIYLLPLIVLASGIIFLASYAIIQDKPSSKKIWNIHLGVLLLSFITEMLVSSKIPIFFLRSGLVNDGVTNALGLCVLGASLLLHLNRFSERADISPQTHILVLCSSFFALIGVHSNRIVFSILSTLGLMVAAKGALLTESPQSNRADHAYILAHKAFGFLVFSVLFATICILTFGDTQFDQIQIRLARSRDVLIPLQIIQLMVIFLAMFVGELPPVSGIFSSSRKNTSWAMSVLLSALFVLVALQIFIKQGIYIFTHVSVGATDLEPQTGAQILEYMRWAASIGLVLLPVLTLLQKNIKQSFLLFMLNPVLLVVMALSFGQRELMAYAMGAIPQIILAMSALILAAKAMGLNFETELKDWIGIGRGAPTQAMVCLAAVFALAGLPPFFGGLLVQKTLCISSNFAIFVIINLALSGYYAARLTVFAFQKPLEISKPLLLFKSEKIFSFCHALALFLMGIFWQPLYKYGAYTVRHLFGDF